MSETKWTAQTVGPKLEQFLRPLLKTGGFAVDFRVEPGSSIDPLFEKPDVTVTFQGRDVDLLLANKAELLLALEQVTLEVMRIRPEDHSRLVFDANEYRMLRVEELRLSAETAADRVKRSGMPFRFNPMNSRERRIIHLALRQDGSVRTESEGLPPRRQVVVYPAGHQPARKPAGR